MFSSMIQNLLSTSGQSNAMQRAVQMHNYVNSINSQWAAVPKSVETPETGRITQPAFDKVLQESAKAKFGDLLTKPTTSVDAQIYTNMAKTAAPKLDYMSKAGIKNLISKVSQKHGVDEKLVNAVVNQESGYNPKAKSRVGAMGLMQLMPETAKGLGQNR